MERGQARSVRSYLLFDPDDPSFDPVFLGALNEMVDYVSVNRGIVTEVIYPEGNIYIGLPCDTRWYFWDI